LPSTVGRIYLQTFIDTYSKLAFAKLYDRKNALTAADMLNDRVLPFFEENRMPMLRILTHRGSEYFQTGRFPPDCAHHRCETAADRIPTWRGRRLIATNRSQYFEVSRL
jgi:hypothetical protein